MLDGRVITGYVVRVLMVLSALGFVYTLVLHGLALMGEVWESETGLAVMYYGLLVVIIPSWLLQGPLVRGYPKEQGKAAVLRGCPKWMRTAVSGLGIYALVGFFAFLFLPFFARPPDGVDPADVSAMLRFTAIAMYVYGLATAILYSGMKVLYTETPDAD